MQFSGRVIQKPFAVGSKSERLAVKLVTDDQEYVLRRQGGNAFADPVLDRLVGATIECEGIVVHGNTLIISKWKRT
jgi:hypothetical protein